MSTEDARKLFVAGLPDTITEDVLRQLFEATGGTVVDVSIPRDRATGRPRGFGFVTLSTSDEAASARDALDGSVQAGRSISVRPFSAEPPRRGEAPRHPGSLPPAPSPDRTLYVGNLPYDCTEQRVHEMVREVCSCEVARVNLPTDPDGRKRGFGFVTMASADDARAALEGLRGVDMGGRRLVVNIAHPKGERPARPEAGGFRGPAGGGAFQHGGPPSERPAGPPAERSGEFGPPPVEQRRTFDERRRGSAAAPASQRPEAEPVVENTAKAGKRRRGASRGVERGRRSSNWRDAYLDDMYDDEE
jgi:RNA recognition motif-containing protein